MANVLYINKPQGITSFDLCFKLRKVFNTKRIGHTGTLDPNATGVMIVLIDKATKAAQFFSCNYKEYKARVLFGIETDTLDIDGKVIKQENYIMPSRDDIINVLNSFLGKSKQVVPLVSAKKINGKKLYEYHRDNIEIEAPEIDIEILNIELNDIYDDGFEFTCLVSSGTYIRSLVRDICLKLNVIGTTSKLCRSKVNDIALNECDELEDVLNGNYHLHTLFEALSRQYKIIEYENIDDIYNGKRIKINSDEDKILICHNNEAIAIYGKDNDEYKTIRGLW